MPTRHYLITGGAGFIGSHLAEALLAAGHAVTIIDDLSTGRMENIAPVLNKPDFRFAIDTITNAMVMDRLMSECDAVFHLAAAVGVELIVTDPVRTIETNVLGTHAVLQAAARYRKKVLLASTSEVYGKGVKVPFAEDDDRLLGPTTKSRWSYSDSKAIDEFLGLAYYKQHALPVIIARFFNTVGPRQTGQYGMVIPRFVRQALEGETLRVYGDGEQSRCFCNVHDVVRALVALIETPQAEGQVYNLGSVEEITIKALARQVLSAVGRPEDDFILVPYAEAYEPGFEDMQRRVPDLTKIRATTGWEPRIPLDETLREVIGYEEHRRRQS
jgi:UDP-glucose 4-epimerase